MILPIPWEPMNDADFREFYKKVAGLYHYPECWDTVAYPTLYDAIYEMRGPCTTCEEEPAADPAYMFSDEFKAALNKHDDPPTEEPEEEVEP